MDIRLYKPHEKQKEIHKAINNTDSFYFILNIGRQFGKDCTTRKSMSILGYQ